MKSKFFVLSILTFVFYFMTTIFGATVNANNTALESIGWHNQSSTIKIPDGWYRIQPMHDLGRSIDALGQQFGNGNHIHMWTNTDALQQKFYLQNRGNGYFSLQSAYGNKLFVTVDGYESGANLYTNYWHGSDSQLFRLVDAGNNSYHIFSKVGTNLNFDCAGGGRTDGTIVQLWIKGDNPWQQWRFTPIEATSNIVTLRDGWYRIQPMHDLSRSIDALGQQIGIGNNVHIWSNTDALQQKFYLQNRGNGYFSLQSAYGDKLFVTADGYESGANLYTNYWYGSDSQLFRLVDAGNDSYHIFSKVGTNLNFDCAGGGRNDGTNVQLWIKGDNPWQQWRFTKVSNSRRGFSW